MRRHALSRPGRTPPGATPAWQVRGRLVHPDGATMHHARVEVFVGLGGREDFLARGIADGRGRFAISFRLPTGQLGATLRIRVLCWRPPQHAEEPAAACWRVAARAISPPLVDPGVVDVGDVVVHGWGLRDGYRLAPIPEELRDGDGSPLLDRPPAPALARRLAAPAPPQVNGDDGLLEALLVPDGAGGDRIRDAAIALGGAVLETERRAVAAFRHLRAAPLAALLLPRLRGAAWLAAAAEHLVRTGAVDLGPPSEVLAAAAAWRDAPCQGRGWAEVREAARVRLEVEVLAWWRADAEAIEADAVEVNAMMVQLGLPALRSPRLAADELRAWIVDTLVLALVQVPWQRAALARVALAGLDPRWGEAAGRVLLPLADDAPVEGVDGVTRWLEGLRDVAPTWLVLGGSVLP